MICCAAFNTYVDRERHFYFAIATNPFHFLEGGGNKCFLWLEFGGTELIETFVFLTIFICLILNGRPFRMTSWA
jgi:hypothetical protein